MTFTTYVLPNSLKFLLSRKVCLLDFCFWSLNDLIVERILLSHGIFANWKTNTNLTCLSESVALKVAQWSDRNNAAGDSVFHVCASFIAGPVSSKISWKSAWSKISYFGLHLEICFFTHLFRILKMNGTLWSPWQSILLESLKRDRRKVEMAKFCIIQIRQDLRFFFWLILVSYLFKNLVIGTWRGGSAEKMPWGQFPESMSGCS